MILLVNDDGYSSLGFKNVCESVKDLNVFAIAPMYQQTGKGQSRTFFETLSVSQVQGREFPFFCCDGTPVDCVNIGLKLLDDDGLKPDLCISGFNIGFNLCFEHIFTSGTVGAALEAACYGIPSIAVSIEVPCDLSVVSEFPIDFDFNFSKFLLRRIVMNTLKFGYPDGVDMLNVNIPLNPINDEIVFSDMGHRYFHPKIEEIGNGKYVWLDGEYDYVEEVGSDYYTVNNKKQVSITPFSVESGCFKKVNSAEETNIKNGLEKLIQC